MAGQSEIITREVARVDVPAEGEALDDLGRNADLYIFHQDDADSQQVNDVRSGRRATATVSTLKRAQTCIVFSRLVLTKSRRCIRDLCAHSRVVSVV